MEWVLVKTLMSLLAVLGLMTGIVILLKKYVYKGHGVSTAVVSIDVLGHTVLSPKRSIHVLRVLNKIVIVGVTEGGMTSLGEINDEECLAEIDGRITDRTANPNLFTDYLQKYFHSTSRNGSKTNGKANLG
jgi:flagellar biogenesis protein FliO